MIDPPRVILNAFKNSTKSNFIDWEILSINDYLYVFTFLIYSHTEIQNYFINVKLVIKPFVCTCELFILNDLFDFSKELLRDNYSYFLFFILKSASDIYRFYTYFT